MERALDSPESMLALLLDGFGDKALDIAPQQSKKLEEVRDQMAARIANLRQTAAPAATQQWAVRAAYRGVEKAQVVVVNTHGGTGSSGTGSSGAGSSGEDSGAAERLVAEVKRLRTDKAVFRDVFGHSGSRVPITAVVADLSDPRHPGLRKILTRIKRALQNTD